MKLDSTAKTIEVILSSTVASNQLDWVAAYVDIDQANASWANANENNGVTNNAVAVTMVNAPASGETRKIDFINVHNNDTASAEVTVRLNNSASVRVLAKVTLEPGDSLFYTNESGWNTVNKKKALTSTNNATTSALSGGATYTGVADLNDCSDVMVSCFADVAGTLYFDFSINGSDWRTYPTSGFKVAAGIHEFHTAVKGPRHFRVRYVNGASAQSTFQLQTYYGDFDKPTSPLNQAYGLDSDSIIVRSTFPWLDISRGLATGIQSIKKFGRNDSLTTTIQPVALGGIYQTPQVASATTLRIKAGGNANDTAAGSGAREITLIGLDENFDEVSETLATAGASASAATTTTFTRVYRAYVSKSGTYATSAAGSHAGNIVVEDSAGTNDWLTIDSSFFPISQSEIGAYSIPAGYTGYIKLRDVTADTGRSFDLIFFQRGNIDETAAPYTAMRGQSVLVGVDGGAIGQFGTQDVPFGPYAGPCDVGFMAKLTSGSGGKISVEFEIILINE